MFQSESPESNAHAPEPQRFNTGATSAKSIRDQLTWFALFVITMTTLAHVACSMSTKEKLTNFFFDVPSANSTNGHELKTDSALAADSTDATTSSDAASTRNKTLPASIHPPYLERQCIVCHEAERSNRVSETIMDECSDCHEDYFGKNVEHPPVQRKECMKCHEPHVSSQPHLLSRTVFRTCMQCHKKPENLSPESHSGDKVQDCTKCHDPHFGKSPMIKTAAATERTTPQPE